MAFGRIDCQAVLHTGIKSPSHVYIRLPNNYDWKNPIKPKKDEIVFSWGFQEGKFRAASGLVTGTNNPINGGYGFTLSFYALAGASGSPVVDENGILIGIIWGGQPVSNDPDQITQYALNSTAIIGFLVANSVPAGTSNINNSPYKFTGGRNFAWEWLKHMKIVGVSMTVEVSCRTN